MIDINPGAINHDLEDNRNARFAAVMTNFDFVRRAYGVPAQRGRRVVVDGEPGVIAEDRGHYIGVLFDRCRPTLIYNCHPTWRVTYLDKIAPVRRPTRSQRRYMRFLEADCGHSFGEWLKRREAA